MALESGLTASNDMSFQSLHSLLWQEKFPLDFEHYKDKW